MPVAVCPNGGLTTTQSGRGIGSQPVRIDGEFPNFLCCPDMLDTSPMSARHRRPLSRPDFEWRHGRATSSHGRVDAVD